MLEQQKDTDGYELVQCPNCLGYFHRQLEPDAPDPEDAITKHVCWIGGRQV